ncbi:hypothetical protein LINPERHAP2_LOCUS29953, partial [Linum perenne]
MCSLGINNQSFQNFQVFYCHRSKSVWLFQGLELMDDLGTSNAHSRATY